MDGMDDWFSLGMIWMMVQVVFIDILLGGDNAIVIALAAGRLPKEEQNKAIVIGTAGAIGIRFLMAAVIVWLLRIPFLHLAGGLFLLLIGVNLLRHKKEPDLAEEEGGHTSKAAEKYGLPGAVATIMAADAIMSLDNVIGIVGVAQGSFVLILAGMCISVPVIMWGSHFFIYVIERYPLILYIGGAVLGWAAGGMIAADPELSFLKPFETIVGIVCVMFVPGAAWVMNRMTASAAR